MELPCPLAGDTGFVPQGKYIMVGVLSRIINPLLTKLVRSRWLDIGQVLFCVFMDRDGSAETEKFRKTGPPFEVDHFTRLDRSKLTVLFDVFGKIRNPSTSLFVTFYRCMSSNNIYMAVLRSVCFGF